MPSIFNLSSLLLTAFLYQQYCPLEFQCGSIANITYPFWKKTPLLSHLVPCGPPDFGLDCQGNVPILDIGQLSYQVLEINFNTSTLHVARQDLWNTTCPNILKNITLNSGNFEFPPNTAYQIVTLYFDCATDFEILRCLPNEFFCWSSRLKNYFKMGNGVDFTCNNSIWIPVNATAAVALESPSAESRNILQDAFASGFPIRWSTKDVTCQECTKLGGICGYNSNSNRWTHCHKSEGGRLNRLLSSPTSSPRQRGIFISRSVLVAGAICLILGSIIVCWCCKKRSSNIKSSDASLPQLGSIALKKYRYSNIKKITNSFNDKLGQGGYGSVYKGTLSNGRAVAVKVLMEVDSNGEEFINEVISISRTSHVNIVNLLGFCYEKNKRALVYEFMPNKSLDKFIGKVENQNFLDVEKLYEIAIGVAKGLEYLHTGCNTRIVHFDIKPQNILLDEEFNPKISDFGLAKLCRTKKSILSLIGVRGTFGYMAPEVFSRYFGPISLKSDVYSYGMMVLEMAGAKDMVEAETTQSSENYFPDKIYEKLMLDLNVTREQVNNESIIEEDERVNKMLLVGFWCIQTAPSDRPSMSRVAEMLEGNLESIQIPPKPILCHPNISRQELSTYMETEESNDDSPESMV